MKNCNQQKATDNVPSLEKGSMNMCGGGGRFHGGWETQARLPGG